MNIWPFSAGGRSVLGIDIGSSAIRVVELSKHGDQEKLQNYGRLTLPMREPRYFGEAKKGELAFSTKQIAAMLLKLIEETKVKGTSASFSIPDFSSLFTTFELPPMKREEAAEAVRFEARQRVPLPISEVTLDWLKIGGDYAPRGKGGVEILLVVVPNRVIDRYTRIADLCGLDLYGIEAEVFGLQRSLLRNGRGVICMVDIGAQSTTANIVDEGVLKLSHSFDVAGNSLTARVKDVFKVSYREAEVVKANRGLMDERLEKVLPPLLGKITSEVEKAGDRFYNKKGKEVEKYIFAGATASLPGFKDFLLDRFEVEVDIAFPFEGMVYPPILENEVRKIGPGFSIATGMAIKSLGR